MFPGLLGALVHFSDFILDVSPNTSFGKISASDPDTLTNCALQYSIPPGAAEKFAVLGNGNLSTTAELDREKNAQYVFLITVKDCATPPLTDDVRVIITVADVNDNSPKFPGPYDVSIKEGESSGSRVVQVEATGKYYRVYKKKGNRTLECSSAFII